MDNITVPLTIPALCPSCGIRLDAEGAVDQHYADPVRTGHRTTQVWCLSCTACGGTVAQSTMVVPTTYQVRLKKVYNAIQEVTALSVADARTRIQAGAGTEVRLEYAYIENIDFVDDSAFEPVATGVGAATYLVRVPQVHLAISEVRAASPDDARARVARGEGTHVTLNYSRTLSDEEVEVTMVASDH